MAWNARGRRPPLSTTTGKSAGEAERARVTTVFTCPAFRCRHPAASAQNNLARQFWGDYNTLVSTNANAFFIYTDSQNGVGCTAVDKYQHGLITKPSPETDCPNQQFGNTDAFVSKITP